ncbi:GSCFA domain-containing protein [Gluconacetobacter tumulicola]|uniref:GSCFA domain-containing protein n=1 Tax=Gluconacetobacter tumulicola TaxID=1017177 RepID=A0A7W4JDR1_9PROT|nr:GSCFA domain-containing protein [Gluconacetobacter tumulicola]MBB2179179.1 GSCFA domain-containing protein [Gluconacetobacter tumulicola]
MSNPYANLKDYQFWRRSISRMPAHLIDPVINTRFTISRDMKIVTSGSCFAQHISRRISEIGFNYYVPESGLDLPESERKRRNFGVFSARYGNIYTPAQLNQLFDEIYSERKNINTAWMRPDRRFIDPYRQQIEPDAFETAEDVVSSRVEHLRYVKDAFENCDVFVFTLGLTEAWISLVDNAVFPLAPGVVGGTFDPEKFKFINFNVEQTAFDMESFLSKLKSVNPNVKCILTVSPVPLIATYEDKHVLTSTTYSKSVLRVVAEMMTHKFDWVDYFPSYEIITGGYSAGNYYEEDFREINSIGVSHAMRCFLKNYIEGGQTENEHIFGAEIKYGESIVICDEAVLASARQ